jgi:centractin
MSLSQKREIATIFFDLYNCPAIFFAPQPILSLYAQGKMTGLVLDSGDGVTQCAALYDSYNITGASSRMNLGGRDVTEYLKNKLRLHGFYFHTSVTRPIQPIK